MLWMACDQENPELVGHLLEIEGVSDVSGPDGMTAFALSLGHQNVRLVEQFLKSNPSPEAKTLARKILQAASPEQRLKETIQKTLWPEGFQCTAAAQHKSHNLTLLESNNHCIFTLPNIVRLSSFCLHR